MITPTSLPSGVKVELSRAPVLPGNERVLELAFRHVDDVGTEWLDADHVAYAKQVKGPGWEELTPQLFLAPDHIRSSIVAWAAQGVIE